jgi:hypothetical protein
MIVLFTWIIPRYLSQHSMPDLFQALAKPSEHVLLTSILQLRLGSCNLDHPSVRISKRRQIEPIRDYGYQLSTGGYR